MKKIITLLLILNAAFLIRNSANAQTLSPVAMPSCGGYFSSGGTSLSVTVGEPFHATLQNGGFLLTQGEQQPYITLCLLNLRAFLQGFYTGTGTQQAVLYNAGLSSDPTACDSITVELHDPFSSNTIVSSNPITLHTDGWAEVSLPALFSGSSYYIVIRHRNSLETWSKFPVTLSNNTTFDFTSP